MSNQALAIRVHDQLKQAVASGLLSAATHKRAVQLSGRLDQPMRIGLLGMSGAGKSKLLNLLVGSNVIPEGIALPTVQLTYGDSTQVICTLDDGTKTTLDDFGSQTALSSVDMLKVVGLKPTFIEIRLPLAALKKISVFEVAGAKTPEALLNASQWAAKRCDVAMWCTRGYVPMEQNIWAQMPDMIKDHAFLMLTHADQIAAAGKLDIAMTAVRRAAGDEFNHVLPIATVDALGARKPDGTVDKDVMRQSGGLALISAVLKQFDQGRQSAVDMADILLIQNEEILAGKKISEQNQDDKVQSPADDKAHQAAKLSVVEEIHVSNKETTPATDTTTRTGHTASGNPAANVVTLQPATRSAYRNALDYIAEQTVAIAEIANGDGPGIPAQIIALAVENVQWLSAYLDENGDGADVALHRVRTTVLDAADLVQLMQMEKNDSAAIEALSLLLQIKHELQADLAA